MVEIILLGFFDQIIRIHGDAMAADSAARPVSHKSIGLGGRAPDDIGDIDVHLVERFGQLVHKRNIDVRKNSP